MATTFTYVSLQNLQQYDSLIKPYIDGKMTAGVASSLKTVSLDGNTLKFYTVAEPVGTTAPAFTIELPQQDLTGFLTKFEAATAGDVVIVGDDGKVIKDSGIKLVDLATLANVDEKIAAAKKLIDADIKKNTGAITTVKIADGVVTKAKLATEVQASLDKADSALQEADIADLKKDVAANKASLAEGGATDTAIKAAKQAADDAKAVADEAKAGVSGLNTRVKALEDVKYVAATKTEIKALFPTA